MSEGLPAVAGYEIIERLGSGATGVVYRAEQLSTGRTVAVKALAPELLGRPGWRERFRAEAQLMTRFDDENLVNVYDYLETTDGAYLVMQHVGGVSLREVLQAGSRFSPEQALGVLAGALSGLAAAHRLGVVHGDLKPENVIVTPEGSSKLVDFGQASPAGSPSSGGTPAYASPEAVRDEAVDARSDVYGAGLLVYELIAGAPPFSGGPAEVAAAHRDALAPRLRGVPPAVAELVARSLSKDPDDRPATAESFLAELEVVATASYGSDWRRRASIAGFAGAVAGGTAGALAGGGAEGGSSTVARAGGGLRHLRHVRRVAARGRAAVSSHPLVSAGVAAVVVAGSVVLAVQGSPVPIAGSFVPVSLSASATGATCNGGRCWVDLGSAILRLGPGAQRSLYQLAPTAGTVSSISCPTGERCVAVGSSPAGNGLALVSTDGGRTWQRGSVPAAAGALAAVSCAPRSDACWATAHNGIVHSVGGLAWVLQRSPPNQGGYGGISCATTRDCVAFANSDPLWTRNGGVTWTAESGLRLLYGSAGLDCVTSSVCFSVGEYTASLQSQIGAVFKSVDGGVSWSQLTIPSDPQPYSLDSVSCWTASSCLVDGTVEMGGLESSSGTPYFLATSDGGRRWSTHFAPATLPYVPAISCSGSSSCLLAGPSGVGTTVDKGASWQPMTYPTSLGLQALGCTVSDCYAAGAFPHVTKGRLGAFVVLNSTPVGAVVRLEGTEGDWSLLGTDFSAVKLSALSCAATGSKADCLAVADSSSNVDTLVRLTPGGPAPVPVRLPAMPESFAGISCPTASGCWVAAGLTSGPVLWRAEAGSWARVRLPTGLESLGSIACPSANSCLVAGTTASGPVLLEVDVSAAATTWSLVTLPIGLQSLSAVECPSPAVCWITGLRQPTPSSGGAPAGSPQAVMYRTVDLGAATGRALASLSTTTTPGTTASTTSTTTKTASSWQLEPLPSGLASVSAVACMSVSSCFALGSLPSGAEVILGAGSAVSPLGGSLAPPVS